MGRPQPMQLGPFTGGMNTYSDPSAIDDSELVDCANMELDIDGSLVSRIPLRVAQAPHGSSAWTTRLKIVGDGVWSTEYDIFGSANAGGLWRSTDPASVDWVKIPGPTVEIRDIVQCGSLVACIPASTGGGGWWSPSTGWIADATLPAGNAGVFFKARLWIVPGPGNTPTTFESRLQFSNPIGVLSSGSLATWPPANTIDVSPGDGQNLVDIELYLDQLLLFKTDSTYVLAYDTSITQSILRCINTEVGATSRVCTGVYEDVVYVFHQGAVFEIKNYTFTQINTKVPFELDASVPTIGGVVQTRDNNAFLCIVQDRIVVRYFNKVYCYGLLTGTWSRWFSTDNRLNNVGYLRAFPTNTIRNTPIRYYGGSVLRDQTTVFEWLEHRQSDNFETFSGTPIDIQCSITTKTLDVNAPFSYKKLGWWGVDVISTGGMTCRATPVNMYDQRSWGSLRTIAWNELLTWAHPTDIPYTEETVVTDSSAINRKFIKLRKALRFKKIFFTVSIPTNGSTSQGPTRIFSVVPWIGQKETVVKQVS